jgi:hypothetical protein
VAYVARREPQHLFGHAQPLIRDERDDRGRV